MTVAGDTLTLTASISSNQAKVPSGKVIFTITNTNNSQASLQLSAAISGGEAASAWSPDTAGVYTITAAYVGDDYYYGSTSTSYTVYVAAPNKTSLALSGNNITYGSSLTMTATELTYDDDTNAVAAEPVELEAGSYSLSCNGTSVSNPTQQLTLSGDGKLVFTPDKAGGYTVTVTYGENTVSKNITVYARMLTVIADDKSVAINKSDRPALTTTLTGLVPDDTVPEGVFDLESDGLTTAEIGDYAISVTYANDVELDSKYNVVCGPGVYSVFEPSYKVTAIAGGNGSVALNYDRSGFTIFASSGDLVPASVSVTASATPAKGYTVREWKINDQTVSGNTSNTLVLDSLSADTDIEVFFTQLYYSLTFGAEGTGGTVSGSYAGVDESFSSGGRLNPLQTVQLTAAADEGCYIKEWRVYKGGSAAEYEVLKAVNGTSTYTGNTYVVSSIDTDTRVLVVFAAKDALTVKVKLVDENGAPLAGSNAVSFNSNSPVKDADSYYTYSGSTGDELIISLNLPASYLIDSWSNLNEIGTLSGDKRTLSIYNLSTNAELTVKCVDANSYTLTAEAQLSPAEAPTTDFGEINMYFGDSDTEIESGSKVPQATNVRIVASPAEGFRVSGFTVNEAPVAAIPIAGGDDQKIYYTAPVGTAGVKVVALFERIPTYEIVYSVVDINGDSEGGLNGAISVAATRNGSNSVVAGGDGTATAYEGSKVVISLTPHSSYRVQYLWVDGVVVTDEVANNTYTIYGLNDDLDVSVQYEPIGNRIFYSGNGHGSVTATYTYDGESRTFNSSESVNIGTITLVAMPYDGYEIGGWYVNGVDMEVTDDTFSYEVKPIGGAEIYVDFAAKNYTLTYGARSGNGTVSADTGDSPAQIAHGTEISFTAIPAVGYKVGGWYVNDELIDGETGTGFSYTINAANVKVQAAFVQQTYTATFNIADSSGSSGTVKVNGNTVTDGGMVSVKGGESLSFTVTPGSAIAYIKVNNNSINNSENQVSETTYTIGAVGENLEIEVKFGSKPSHAVSYYVQGGGTVTATTGNTPLTNGGMVPHGDTVTLTAQADEYCYFEGWIVGSGSEYTHTDSAIRLTVYDAMDVTAVFREIASYKVGFTSDTGGTVALAINGTNFTGSPEATTAKGSRLVFTASPESGQCVDTWTVSSRIARGDISYTIENNGNTLTIPALTADVTVGVSFMAVDYYSVTLPDEAGNTSIDPEGTGENEGKVLRWGSVTFDVPSSDDKMIDLSELNSALGENGQYTISESSGVYNVKISNILADLDLSGIIVPGYPISFNTPQNGSLTVSVGGQAIVSGTKVASGSALTITAKADSGYQLSSLLVNGMSISSGNQHTVVGETIISATFEKAGGGLGGGGGGGGTALQQFTVSFVTNWISAVEPQTVEADKQATEPSMKNRGSYTFGGWYTDKALTDNFDFSTPITSDMTLYAKWVSSGHKCGIFTDIAGHWAFNGICFAVENGMMNGVSETLFAPDGVLTRAMVITILYRLEGEPEAVKSGFEDVEDGKWYTDAIGWAAEHDIVRGYDAKTFRPNDNITREQLAAIIYRYAEYKNFDLSACAELTGFTDEKDISGWALENVKWAVAEGLIRGKADGILDPKGNATRAEVATILERFITGIINK